MARTARSDLNDMFRQLEKIDGDISELEKSYRDKRNTLTQKRNDLEERAFKAILKEKKISLQEASVILGFSPSDNTTEEKNDQKPAEEKTVLSVPATANNTDKGETINDDKTLS